MVTVTDLNAASDAPSLATLSEHDSDADAQAVVDRLSDAGFAVEHLADAALQYLDSGRG